MIISIIMIGIPVLSCILFPKYVEIIVPFTILINAIFSKYQKLPGATDWFYKDEDDSSNKKSELITKIILIITSLFGLIYIFFIK